MQEAAARAIRRTRQHLGISQELLSERAGVSVRTLRSLERANTVRPRPETLARITAALDLDPVSSGRVLAAWATPPRETGGEITFGPVPYADEIREFAASATLLHVDETVQVNTARLRVRETTRVALKSRSGTLTHVYVVSVPDPALRDPEIVDLEGCSVADDVTAGDGVRVVQLALHRAVREHEIGTLRFSRLRRPVFDTAPALDYAGTGFQTPTDLYTLRVNFDSRVRPVRVLRCVQDRPFGSRRALRSIEVGPDGSAVLAIQKPRPAAHLIRWDW